MNTQAYLKGTVVGKQVSYNSYNPGQYKLHKCTVLQSAYSVYGMWNLCVSDSESCQYVAHQHQD